MSSQARGVSPRRSARDRGRSGGRRERPRRARHRAGHARARELRPAGADSGAAAPRKRFLGARVFWSALGGLVALGTGLATTRADRGALRARRPGSASSASRSPRWRCSPCWSSAARKSRACSASPRSKSCAHAPTTAIASDDRDEARAIVRALTAKLAGDAEARARPRRAREPPRRDHRRPRPAAHRRAHPDGAARRAGFATRRPHRDPRLGGDRGVSRAPRSTSRSSPSRRSA